MNEKQLRSNYLSQTKINIFQKCFCEKLEFYTNVKVKFNIICGARKIKSLFKIKVERLSYVIYQGVCSCGHNYIGETIRNAVTRIDEDEQPNGKSEPFKHLKNNRGHNFDWMILSRAPLHRLKRKILQSNPSLNDQLESEILILII